MLDELMDFDDEKPQREKTRKLVKSRSERGYFSNIIRELHCVKSVQIRSFFWSVFGHFSRSVKVRRSGWI